MSARSCADRKYLHVEHWVDILLPLAMLWGLGYGFNTGIVKQIRDDIGLLLGTVLAVWFSATVLTVMLSRHIAFPDPQFGIGVVFAVMLIIGFAVATAIASSFIGGLTFGRDLERRSAIGRALGGVLGVVNAVILMTLLMLTIHLILSGNIQQTWSVARSINRGAEISVTGQLLQRVAAALYTLIHGLLPPGVPPAFHI